MKGLDVGRERTKDQGTSVFRIQGGEEEPGGQIEKQSAACYEENHKGKQLQKTGKESILWEKG